MAAEADSTVSTVTPASVVLTATVILGAELSEPYESHAVPALKWCFSVVASRHLRAGESSS